VIELVLPYPISSNRYWASRIVTPKGKPAFVSVYVTPEAKTYREQCAWAASRVLKAPLSGRLSVHVELYPHRPLDWQARMRKHGECWDDTVQCIDLGNCEKVMSDALQGIVFADDCAYRRIVLDRMEPDEKGERLVVRIEQLQLAAPQRSLLEAA
jgi:crossover junction endodeoxyribonuclease RusA